MSAENPLIFLIRTLIDIYVSILMLRFLLQQVRADFYNPISQFIVKLTNPVVMPARKFIPSFRGYDVATLVLVLSFIVIKIVLLATLNGITPGVIGVILVAVQELLLLLINVFMFAIFVQAILSWVNPDPTHPVAALLRSITAPVLRPFQQLIKPISGIDLSPLVALIALMFAKSIVIYMFQML
ncbi:MAG: YggT family protein [Gammaproteobacteria bacterium]